MMDFGLENGIHRAQLGGYDVCAEKSFSDWGYMHDSNALESPVQMEGSPLFERDMEPRVNQRQTRENERPRSNRSGPRLN